MPSGDHKEHMHVSWHDVELQVKEIVDHLVIANAKPHVIMAIGFGGLIPASMIAYQFGQRTGRKLETTTVYAHSYEDEKRGKLVSEMTIHDVSRFSGRQVLIIDDIADSGNTLKYILRAFPTALTATLVYKAVSIIRPDYFGHLDTDGDKWWYVWP